MPRPNCYLCGARGKNLYHSLSDHVFRAPGLWRLIKCESPECGLVWLNPMPSVADIEKAYAFYYTHQLQQDRRVGGSLRGLLRLAYHAMLRASMVHRQRARLGLMYLDETTPGRLLDIGSGDGSRLTRLRTLGWQVEGQEVDAQAAAVARSDRTIPVYLGALEDIGFPASTFDAITMNHVIEHVHEPVGLLKECYRILKPGGSLIAVTPNVESYGHKFFGRDWRGLEPPRHLYLFSQQTLRTLARRAGFSVCDVWTTAAHAEVIAGGSLEVRAARKLKEGKPVATVTRRVMSIAFQLWMQLAYVINKNSGEECVLKVAK